MDPIIVIPHSLDPQQVNSYQKPVFTVRVRNVTADEVLIAATSRLILKSFASMPGHGFTLPLEHDTWLGPGRETVLRFDAPMAGIIGLNTVPHPVRFEFDVRGTGFESTFSAQDITNTVRYDGHAGEHVESVKFLPLFDPFVVLDRQGGFARCSAGHADNHPVDLTIRWKNPAVGWAASSDDGIDLVAQHEFTLRQVRWSVPFGIALVPDPSIPANVVQVVGTVVAARCPLQSPAAGLGACIGAGSRVRAIVAESALIELASPEPIAGPLVNGTPFELRAPLSNRFNYPVDLRNFNRAMRRSAWPTLPGGSADGTFSIEHFPEIEPEGFLNRIGVRLLGNGQDLSRHVTLQRFVGPDALGPGETLVAGWRCVLRGAPPGRYRLQPFTTTTVWINGRHWENRYLQAEIDPGAADPAYGIDVDVT